MVDNSVSSDDSLFFETYGDYIVDEDHSLRKLALIERPEERILIN